MAALTALGFRATPVNATTQGFLYLIVILVTAAWWGLVEAVLASLVAVLCYNYFFLPPVGTLTIQDPQNWVALGTFLITAIIASRLSSQLKNKAIEIARKQEDVERLYTLSRAMLLLQPGDSVAKQIAAQIARAFEATAVVVYTKADHSFHRAGPGEFAGLDEQVQAAASEGTQFRQDRNWITSIRLGGEPIGSIGISGVDLTDSALQSAANLAAIGLERSRAQDLATRAEAARQSDELKSMLLDGIAHEFQTPLTTIKAASSALLSSTPLTSDDRAMLVRLIDEEGQRLSSLVSDAIQMARIETGKVGLHLQRVAPADLIGNVLTAKRTMLEDRKVETNIPAGTPSVILDPDLMVLALRQLLDNAIKYSDPETSILISARQVDAEVQFCVRDFGMGIAPADLPRIFEKFYRGHLGRDAASGSGLGLAIAHAIVHAHAGRIWAESESGKGAAFFIALPLQEAP